MSYSLQCSFKQTEGFIGHTAPFAKEMEFPAALSLSPGDDMQLHRWVPSSNTSVHGLEIVPVLHSGHRRLCFVVMLGNGKQSRPCSLDYPHGGLKC